MAWLSKLFWNDDERRVRALWRLLLHGLTMAILAVVMGIVLWPLLSRLPGSGSEGIPGVGEGVFALALIGLSTWLCTHVFDKRRFDDLGFNFELQWWLDLGAGGLLGVLLMAGIFGLEWAMGWLTIEGTFVGAAEGQPFALALVAPFLVFVCVAIYEELLSRGYHMRNLAEGLHGLGANARQRGVGPRAALVIATVMSSTVFGLMHAGNPSATWISSLNIALAGCMLAVGPALTGELGFAIGLHLTWNFCQGSVFGFPVSGTFAGPRVVAIEQGGDALITGGEFGPEAGLLGVAACLLGGLATLAWVRVTRGPLDAEELRELVEPPERTGPPRLDEL